ncbi:MAG: hypothetical protein ACRD6X_07105, partial [Pyrinomonadaceae bacterium]
MPSLSSAERSKGSDSTSFTPIPSSTEALSFLSSRRLRTLRTKSEEEGGCTGGVLSEASARSKAGEFSEVSGSLEITGDTGTSYTSKFPFRPKMFRRTDEASE